MLAHAVVVSAAALLGAMGCSEPTVQVQRLGPLPPDAPFEAAGIAAGDHTSCAWSDDGRARCWGRVGTDGGSPQHTAVPVPFFVGLDVVELDVGKKLLCARLADHTVRCAELGDDGAPTYTPAELGPAVDLDVNRYGACAALEDGSAACWGRVGWAPSPEHPHTARPLPGMADVVRISCDMWGCMGEREDAAPLYIGKARPSSTLPEAEDARHRTPAGRGARCT